MTLESRAREREDDVSGGASLWSTTSDAVEITRSARVRSSVPTVRTPQRTVEMPRVSPVHDFFRRERLRFLAET